jgi:MFS family permease
VTAGFLTATLAITQTIGNASMGWLGDRLGHRSMLIVGALAGTGSSLLVLTAPSPAWLYPAFALAGITNVSIWTIGMAMTVDFGSEEERPIYIGLANTLVAPATILAPVVGGLLAEARGYSATFALSAAICLMAVGILLAAVRDPAHQNLRGNYEPVS